MPRSSWVETLMVMEADGTALTTNNVSTSVINPQAKLLLKPGYFDRIGKGLRIHGSGRVTTANSVSSAHAVSVLCGATTIFTSLFSSMNNNGAATNLPFTFEIKLVCRAIGTSANVFGAGTISANYLDTTGFSPILAGTLSASPPAVGTSFDATASQTVDFQMNILTAAISSIQLHTYFVESLN